MAGWWPPARVEVVVDAGGVDGGGLLGADLTGGMVDEEPATGAGRLAGADDSAGRAEVPRSLVEVQPTTAASTATSAADTMRRDRPRQWSSPAGAPAAPVASIAGTFPLSRVVGPSTPTPDWRDRRAASAMAARASVLGSRSDRRPSLRVRMVRLRY